MKRLIVLLVTFFGLMLGVGCGPRAPEITSLQRKEAASLASEADFAMTLRDLPRAESLLTKVVALCPDDGEYWSTLGTVRMRTGNREGAKNAYESALKAYKNAVKLDPKNTEPLLKQVYVLALLGRVDNAREQLEKVRKDFPEDRLVREFLEGKQLDRLLAEPEFKQVSL